MEVEPIDFFDFFKKELHGFPKTDLEAGDFPNTDLEDSEFPKTKVKKPDFFKKKLHDFPKTELKAGDSTTTFLNLVWDSISKVQKHCLLHCLFIPGITYGRVDYELMHYWISSLFLDAEETKQNLKELLDNSVLLQFEGNGGRYIRLPEETYKILQSIHTLNPLFLDISGQRLTEPPDTDRWQNALRIELSDNKLSELPLSPNCMELKVLMLQRNAELTKIPSSFFSHMPLLQIMDLSYTSVRELPHSFFFLEQLRELYLKGCECFMKLPPEIGNLQKLEKLDLDETQITHLPEEVQKLTYMQSLTLYFYEYRGKKNKQYSYSTIIPSGVLSKLKKLKHLSIGVNPDDERWHDNVQVILPEILGLVLLQTLSIYIPQLKLLKLIPAYTLEGVDFRFIVGHHKQRIISSIPPAVDVKFKQSERSLKFVKGKDVPAEIKKLLRQSKALFLDRHVTIKSLSEFKMNNLEELRVCILAECKEMQTIVGGGESNGYGDMLSRLLYLSVSHMKNLRSICEGPITPRFLFSMLQSLSLQSCPKLMTLFSLDFLGNLSLLKELIVKDCPKLSTLINWDLMHNAYTFLPKLRKLYLLHLPELTSIWNGLHIGLGLKEIAFYDCPKLCSLSRKELASNALMAIKGETNWWNSLKGRPSVFDQIFIPIHEEADVMTQLGIYNDDDIDNCAGGPMGKPSQSTDIATPVINSRALSRKGGTDIKQSIAKERGEKMEFDLEDPLASFISELFASESDHMPSPNCLCSTDFHISFRCEAISRISQVQFSRNLDPYVAYLAINYLDRYMSKKEIPQGKPWFLELIVMACLSLASKMENGSSSLSEFQGEVYIFEARTIQRVELRILVALQWRMRSITPFPFLHFFISMYELKDQSLKRALEERASEIIFNAHNDIKFSAFKPSIIAASALISASHELLPLQYSILRASVTACEYLDEEMFSKCFNLMQDMVGRVNQGDKPYKHRNSSQCAGEKHQNTENLMVSIDEKNTIF